MSANGADMHRFLTNNRDELIARCKAKVAERPRRAATSRQLQNGVPLFLEQLTRTLQAEEDGEAWESLRISGASGGDAAALSEIGLTAAAHGKELLALGYTVDQVVHDYGDLCQAITDLAVERDAPFAIDEFRTLNRCLDNAIADAVSSFSAERDASIAVRQSSMAGLTTLIDRALAEVQRKNSMPVQGETFSVALLIAQARESAALDANHRGSVFDVPVVDPLLGIRGNREQLLAALGNLLQNAFRFTQPSLPLHALQ